MKLKQFRTLRGVQAFSINRAHYVELMDDIERELLEAWKRGNEQGRIEAEKDQAQKEMDARPDVNWMATPGHMSVAAPTVQQFLNDKKTPPFLRNDETCGEAFQRLNQRVEALEDWIRLLNGGKKK